MNIYEQYGCVGKSGQATFFVDSALTPVVPCRPGFPVWGFSRKTKSLTGPSRFFHHFTQFPAISRIFHNFVAGGVS
jgi:hypothetical protein